MKSHIIHDLAPVGLIGAAEVTTAAIAAVTTHCNKLVAADGGARAVLDHGMMPDAVIGDFDSLDPVTRGDMDPVRLHPSSDQDTTDFEKCLTAIDAPLVVAAGFSGGRLDHELAALSVLVGQPDRRCVLLGPADLCFLAPPVLQLDLPVGCRVSLFPMGSMQGTSQGLRWPIDGLNLALGGRLGTSNEATGPVALGFDTPQMLVILPVDQLDMVVKQLAALPRGWPAASAVRAR